MTKSVIQMLLELTGLVPWPLPCTTPVISCNSKDGEESHLALTPWAQRVMAPRGDAAKLYMDCTEDWLLKQLFSRSSIFKDSVAIWRLGYTYEKAAGFCQGNMLQDYWKMLLCIRWTFLGCWWIALTYTYPEREENFSLLAVASHQRPVDLEEADFESWMLSTVQCSLLPLS